MNLKKSVLSGPIMCVAMTYAAAVPMPTAWPDPRSFGVWLVDTLGGRELIYQDTGWSTFSPIPLVKRSRTPANATAAGCVAAISIGGNES